MKKNIIGVAVFVLSISACKKGFLDLAPVSQVSTANFYKTENDIDQAVTGAYDALQNNSQYGRNFIYYMEVASDNSTAGLTNSGGIYGDFDQMRVVPSNVVLDQTWKSCYNGIQRCNVILNRIDAVPMNSTTKEIRKAEVKFLRALIYFNLVRIWGDVPLVVEEVANPFDAFGHVRDSAAKVYRQIILDLSDAAISLPAAWTGANKGRVTNGAAKALLGKVHLTLHDYTNAVAILEQVITSGTYSLLPVYADVFKIANKNSVESIFEVQFLKGGLGEGSSFANLFSPSGNNTLTGGIGNGQGDNIPTKNLIEFFKVEDDPRRTATIDSLTDKRPYTKKFLDTPFQPNDASNNFPVLRYADVVLMYAEALNELGYAANGEAFAKLNMVRTRAGAVNYTSDILPDQASFRLAIEKERRFELAFENHRFFDLVRTNRVLTVLNSSNGGFTMQPHQVLFPVPQTQIDANPNVIMQNPGY